MSVRDEVAKNLIFYRKKKNLTQKALAEKIGVGHTTVSQWEKAINSMDMDMLHNICLILDVTFNEMFGRYAAVDVVHCSQEENELITNYRNLNQTGKAKAIEFMEDMLVNPKYTNFADEMAASLEIGNLKEVKKLRESNFSSDNL